MTSEVEAAIESLEAMGEEHRRVELEARIERSWALRIEGALAARSPWFVLIVGLLLLTLIGVIDSLTGEFAVSPFYLVPIGLVTFARGRSMGLAVSFLGSAVWAAVDVSQGVTTSSSALVYWNGLIRFFGFAVIVLLIGPMRQAMVIERELAHEEAEAAEQLRALNELREVASVSGFEPENR
jgi:hypothetical protein